MGTATLRPPYQGTCLPSFRAESPSAIAHPMYIHLIAQIVKTPAEGNLTAQSLRHAKWIHQRKVPLLSMDDNIS